MYKLANRKTILKLNNITLLYFNIISNEVVSNPVCSLKVKSVPASHFKSESFQLMLETVPTLAL